MTVFGLFAPARVVALLLALAAAYLAGPQAARRRA